MSEGLIIAIIGTVVSLGVAYITARIEARAETSRRFAEHDNRFTEHAVKLDLLWDVYIRDAVRDAREIGLTRKNSPMQITERWDEIIPEELRKRIDRDIAYWVAELRSPYDASIEVYRKHKEALGLIAEEEDIRNTAIIGTLFVQAKSFEEDL